jgi:hypothetical protein
MVQSGGVRGASEADAILHVMLRSSALGGLVAALTNWLARAHNSRVTITRPDGRIIVENITAHQAVELARRLTDGAD